MTGKLLTGTLSQHKQTNEPCHEKTNVLVSDLVRHKPGCTATEDGLRLEISDLESRSYYICSEGSAMALLLEPWTPDRETRVRSSAGSVCCFLEQETFTPQKYW